MSTKAEFALTKTYTPILNTLDFKEVFGGKDGISLPLDSQKLLRAVETILFPGTKVLIQKTWDDYNVVQITSSEYNYRGDFFVDKRFLDLINEEPKEREIILPVKDVVLKNLKSLEGVAYIWGAIMTKASPNFFGIILLKAVFQRTYKRFGHYLE